MQACKKGYAVVWTVLVSSVAKRQTRAGRRPSSAHDKEKRSGMTSPGSGAGAVAWMDAGWEGRCTDQDGEQRHPKHSAAGPLADCLYIATADDAAFLVRTVIILSTMLGSFFCSPLPRPALLPSRPTSPSPSLPIVHPGGSRMVSRQRGSVCVRTCVRVMERRRVGRGLLEESLRGVALYTTLLLASAIRHPTRALVYSSSWSGRGSSSLPGAAPPWL